MNWVLIVVLLVFAGCICMGYRRGFLRLAYSLVSWILMFMIVSWATPYISRYIFEHTSIYEQVAAHCEEVIHQTAEERAGEQADSQEQKLQDLGIVIHHQKPQAVVCRGNQGASLPDVRVLPFRPQVFCPALLPVNRQIQGEQAALSGLAFHIQAAPVGADDLFHQGQAQAGALSPLLGGKKGIKDPVSHLPAHAAAIVPDLHTHIPAPVIQVRGQMEAVRI